MATGEAIGRGRDPNAGRKERPPRGKASKAKAKPAKELNSAGLAAAAEAQAEGKDEDKAKVENWADNPESDTYQDAAKLYAHIQKCYDNKQEQSDNIGEYWNIYTATPDENQQYAGNSTGYIPAARDAINARCKRTLAQLFPANHKHVDAFGASGETPFPQLSLIEHYIRSTKLKNRIVRPMLIAGDVTGQWNLYVDWTKSYRTIREIVRAPLTLENKADPTDTIQDPMEDEERLEETEIVTEGPEIVPFATEDLAVYPATVNDIEKATATCIRLRMSKDAVQTMIDQGIFTGVSAEELVTRLSKPSSDRSRKDPQKQRSNDAGVKTEGAWKFALIYEVHTDLKLSDEKGARKEPAYVYFAGENQIIGIIRNPVWSGKRPVISKSIEEIEGSFFGISKVEPIKFLQWNATDVWNMGMDSLSYSNMPIVMTDPLKSPQYQSFVLGLAAVWLTNPNDTKFVNFPAIWKDAVAGVETIKRQIWESLDVNEQMMGRPAQGRQTNAKVGAQQQEQSSNIMDHAQRFEEEILDELVERIFELDRQFRTEAITVKQMGEIGIKAKMQQIPPSQWEEKFTFKWNGTAFQMTLQRLQQQIAAVNVARGIPPELLGGKRLDLSPVIERLFENTFGPELTPHILIDERDLFTVDPDEENTIMFNNMAVNVHPADDDPRHILSHQKAAISTGDPNGKLRAHIAAHVMQLNAKRQKQQAAMKGEPGVPGGAGPGVAGTPRIGAQPGQPRPQGPPGSVHRDQAADPNAAGKM